MMSDTGILNELVSIIRRANIDPEGVNAWFVSLANSGDPFIDFLAFDDTNVYNVRVWLDYKSLKPCGRLIFNSITDKQKQQLRDILSAIEEEFAVDFPMDELFELNTVESIVNKVIELKNV